VIENHADYELEKILSRSLVNLFDLIAVLRSKVRQILVVMNALLCGRFALTVQIGIIGIPISKYSEWR